MSFFGGSKSAQPKPAVQIQVAEEEPHSFYLHRDQHRTSTYQSPNPPFEPAHPIRSLVDVGIFKDTIAPSFALHGSLAVVAWGVGRATDRVEAKDWLCMSFFERGFHCPGCMTDVDVPLQGQLRPSSTSGGRQSASASSSMARPPIVPFRPSRGWSVSC